MAAMEGQGAAGAASHRMRELVRLQRAIAPPGWLRLLTCATALLATGWLSGESGPLTETQTSSRRLHESGHALELKEIMGSLKKVEEQVSTLEDRVDQLQEEEARSDDRKDKLAEERAGRDATEFEEEDGEQEAYTWTWQSWLLAACLLLCCGGGVCCCCVIWLCFGDMSLLSEWQFCCTPSSYLPLTDRDIDDVGLLLRREMRLVMLYPLIPLLSIRQTTCEEGAPTWVYAVFAPLLLRAKYMEWRILERLGIGSMSTLLSMSFMLGTLDSADWMTDGIFPVQAYKCDPAATSRFADSFSESWAWPFSPIVMSLHFYGLAYMVLIVGGMAQQALGVADIGPEDHVRASAADAQGFGAVAKHYDGEQNVDNLAVSTALKMFARVLLENCLQLWLQSSFFGLVFDRLSSSAKQKALLSLILGLLSATYKAIRAAKAALFAEDCLTRLWVIVPLIALGMVAWTGAKIYFAYHCESHLWNLTTLDCAHFD